MRQDLAQRLEETTRQVDRALEQYLRREDPNVKNLHDGALYAMGLDQDRPAARGKRLRPALCLMTCRALGADESNALPFAAAVELLHNFFLVHDDIEDGDRFRRGRPSVWRRYGLDHAINIGDLLFARVYDVLLAEENGLAPPLRLGLARLLCDTAKHTIAGQALEMNARRERDIGLEEYFDIVSNKTSHYLAAPMVGGAMIARAQPAVLDALRAFGALVGPVFQIVDDLIDLTEGKGRDETGSDIREGKRSFLVVHAADRADAPDRARLFDILDKPREETDDADIEWARDLFRRTDAFQAGRDQCRRMMDQARQALEPAPENLRTMLCDLFEDLLERKT